MGNKSILDAASICAIIKACGEAKVVRFTYGDLCLQFDQTVEEQHSPAPSLPPASLEATQTQESERALVQDEVALREDQLRQMLIEDPAAAERLFMEGELDDDGEAEET